MVSGSSTVLAESELIPDSEPNSAPSKSRTESPLLKTYPIDVRVPSYDLLTLVSPRTHNDGTDVSATTRHVRKDKSCLLNAETSRVLAVSGCVVQHLQEELVPAEAVNGPKQPFHDLRARPMNPSTSNGYGVTVYGVSNDEYATSSSTSTLRRYDVIV